MTIFDKETRFDYEYPPYELKFEPSFVESLQGIIMEDLSELDAPIVKVKSAMSCEVNTILKEKGDKVKKGEVLLQVSAMKQVHKICSITDGIVGEISVSIGDNVQSGQVLMKVNKEEEGAEKSGKEKEKVFES